MFPNAPRTAAAVASAAMLAVLLWPGTAVAEAAARNPEQARFSSHWDGRWRAYQLDGQCLLELPVADYGDARFVASPGLPISFELMGSRDLLAGHGVSLRTVAPAWHPQFPYSGPWQLVTHIPGFGLRVEAPAASRLLMDFYEGYEQQVGADGVYGAPPSLLLGLGVLKFRAAYDDFMRCQEGNRPVSLQALHRTRVNFPTGSHKLSPKHRQQLRQVAAYVLKDPRVARVYVDGYTDDVGSERANVMLSKRRAASVAEFLRDSGLEQSLLKVRFHGERYPVVAADSESARSRNRRTTVRVELAATDGF